MFRNLSVQGHTMLSRNVAFAALRHEPADQSPKHLHDVHGRQVSVDTFKSRQFNVGIHITASAIAAAVKR